MHELSIAPAVVDMVRGRTGPRQVSRVRLKVGRLSGVVPDTLEFCFALAAAGTPLEGAALEIDEPGGAAHCRTCDDHFTQPDLILLCLRQRRRRDRRRPGAHGDVRGDG